jgi:hypothetical protein
MVEPNATTAAQAFPGSGTAHQLPFNFSFFLLLLLPVSQV